MIGVWKLISFLPSSSYIGSRSFGFKKIVFAEEWIAWVSKPTNPELSYILSTRI